MDGLIPLIHEDGKIHAHFQQTVTATGRISCTEPNLQNIPIRMELGKLIRKVFYPKEGTNVFVDACCVPKNASNYEAAMLYINFLMEPEIALANAEYICYASPNTAVTGNPDYEYYENEILYPDPDTLPPTEYFHDIDPEIRSYYEKLWEGILLAD